jgi:prepilin-type N-terminal cleavage/methylation domain-containing protein
LPVLKRLREARKNESGFTLIELLIVIVILGVLAGIVVFAVSAFTKDGKVTACKADVKSVEVAAEAFRAKTGAYPTALTSAARFALLTTAGNEYLKSVPNSPDYVVTLQANGVVEGDLTGNPATTDCSA